MTTKTFTWIKLTIVITAGAGSGISWALNIPYLPLIFIPAAIITLIFLGKAVKDRVRDERLYSLAYKAARISFISYVLPAAAFGGFLIQYDLRNGQWGMVGWALLISTAFLMSVYCIAYIILTRKY